MTRRFCIKCGKQVGEDEPLINGMCPQCFLKYKGIFTSRPVLEIIICPRCGSWRYRGEWHRHLSLLEVIRRVLIRESYRFLDKRIELVDATILAEPYKINEAQHAVKAKLSVLLEKTYPVEVEEEIILVINKTVCPRCIAVAGKVHKALVQIRSARGYLDDNDKRLINKALGDHGVISEIVEIKENKHGLDVKLLSPMAAKRLSSLLNRIAGAKVTESFKPTHYNPDKGRWDGIITLSVRLPDIEEDDLVEVDGKPAVVRKKDSRGMIVEMLDDGTRHLVSYEQYWNGRLTKPGYMVYEREYTIIASDRTTLYLLNEETGEMKEFPRTANLRDAVTGDKVRMVRVKDKVYMVKNKD